MTCGLHIERGGLSAGIAECDAELEHAYETKDISCATLIREQTRRFYNRASLAQRVLCAYLIIVSLRYHSDNELAHVLLITRESSWSNIGEMQRCTANAHAKRVRELFRILAAYFLVPRPIRSLAKC